MIEDSVPEWLRTAATLLLGAGAAKILAIWLENRRLTSKDYRETLLERVRELEGVVSSLQTRVGNLRVEVAHLSSQLDEERELAERLRRENDELRARLEDDVPFGEG